MALSPDTAPGQIGFGIVRELGLALPDVEEGTVYGSPALKVRGKMFACIAINRSAEPDSLIACVGVDERERLIAEEPTVYYLTDHYVNGPVVLARLGRVDRSALKGLLQTAWRFTSTRSKPQARRRKSRRA